jgi:2,3-bisphosphoglycerate-dependent phosphoglycerate mutase
VTAVVRAILLRHAESERNVAGTIGGDPSLSVAGRAQARALALRLPPVDLAVTSGLRRAEETASLAAPGPARLVLPELKEIHFGRYEGGPIEPYLEWASTAGPDEACPGGGESRAGAVRRYVRGWRTLLARPEATLLVVAHGLVVRYMLDALEGRNPAPSVDGVPWAEPFALERPDLERAVARLDAWVQNPRW